MTAAPPLRGRMFLMSSDYQTRASSERARELEVEIRDINPNNVDVVNRHTKMIPMLCFIYNAVMFVIEYGSEDTA